jgi:hypothetical protein
MYRISELERGWAGGGGGAMSGEEGEERARAAEERRLIVEKYDRGRVEGALIDDWEDPKLEYYHKKDRSVQCCASGMWMFIPDPNFFHPGSKFFPSRITDPRQRIYVF